MSKKIIALLAAATLAFGLAACQPKASDTAATDNTAATDTSATDNSQPAASTNAAAPADSGNTNAE